MFKILTAFHCYQTSTVTPLIMLYHICFICSSWLFTAGLVIAIIAVLFAPLIICMSIIILVIITYIIVSVNLDRIELVTYCIVFFGLQKYYYRLLLVRKGDLCLQDYLKQFDNLLVLFTKCLRLIQEAEVISRGYTR